MAALELPGRTLAPTRVAPNKVYETGHRLAKPQPRYCKAAQDSGAGECPLLPIKCCAQRIVAALAGGSDKPFVVFGPARLLKTSIIEKSTSGYARQTR